MSSLSYTLDWAEYQIRKDSSRENAMVKERVKKLCKDIKALKKYAENLPEPVEFIGICGSEEFLRRFARKRYCSACHKDITLVGGWRFPQEPDKLFCSECEERKWRENLDKRYPRKED